MEIIVRCPHCTLPILIQQRDINCAIFRHGTMKKNGNQMDPHTPKELCDFLAREGLIYGCGKPFKLLYDTNNDDYCVIKCDYI
jgi:hypothetical protein